jgi:His-Xaa-Ser system protein HxsD
MDVVTDQQNGVLEIRISKALYEKEAVLAATYAVSGYCRNRIEPEPAGYVTVTLELIDSYREKDLGELEHKFCNALLDQQLRLELESRYGPIRRLIVQHAFAPLQNLQAEVKKIAGRE